jgi:hypothetical protein
MENFDPKRLTTTDWVLAGVGLFCFIVSFFHFYTASANLGVVKVSASKDAWGAGFGSWFPMLLMLALGVVAFLRAFDVSLPTPGGIPVLGLGVSALSLIILLLRWATFPTASGVDSGPAIGFWLGAIAVIVAGVFSGLEFRKSGMTFNQLMQRPQPPAAPGGPVPPA